jgi:hypothetical protein
MVKTKEEISMIFNNELPLTEQEIIEVLKRDAEVNSGFIFRVDYDNDQLILSEANISQVDLGIQKYNKKKQPRYIMITAANKSDHSGRMKVSLYNTRITPNNKNQYISIYRKDQNTISYDGSLKSIDMTTNEFKQYAQLFIRNENLIQFIRYTNGKYDSYADKAFIDDENLRRQGYNVIRDRFTGSADVYDQNNKLVYIKNIGGDITYANEVH